MKIYIDDNYVTDNSSECEANCYFVQTSSNAKFTQVAVEKGAKIVSLDECKRLLKIDENIKIVGITGTNGKTTTAAAIYSILLDLGCGCGLCGTRGAFVNDERIDAKGLTTSEILRTLSYLKVASEKKCQFFIMEVSSHSIAQKRIESLNFAVKIFTNLTQDHLDYHGTFEEYAAVKNSFLTDECVKIINTDDKNVKFNPRNSISYSIYSPAMISPKVYSLKYGINAILNTPKGDFELNSSLQGEFNLYNLMAAVGCVMKLSDKDLKEISKAVENFGGVAGRMEVVSTQPLVIVDFAHTPDGIEKVLNALKHYKLVVVFGAGGDRDRTKRPKMGKIAQKYASKLIITSDNPRSENPDEIIAEICTGVTPSENVKCIGDRREAIKFGFENLAKDEILVILGKGDEDYQEIKGVKYPFSDKEIVENLCRKFKI
ncbi:MAG: UDP-N-acetylmuramoyl-L-alanyl-D-glutamate--2,6-diaminopimelate ligase [Campylobacter sp.]